MARTKTRYRQFEDGGRVDQAELPSELPTERPIEAISAPPEAPAPFEPPAQPAEPQPEQPEQDGATLALKKQIEALNQARTMEQQAALTQLSANERRQAWLAQTPGAKDHIPALGAFHHAALNAGLVDASPQYFDFMGSQLATLQAQQSEKQQPAPTMQPTPKFFAPPGRSAPNPSAFVSAPVSREVPNGSGKRHTPGKVTLTAAEVEAARIANISVEEYARQKLLYSGMLADGSYRDNRGER